MAQPFLRIDLSNQARDFQNIVIEAGWPLIDKGSANFQILRKWLGGAVAEPERKGEEVVFYIRNESGQRINDPKVKKVNDKELAGPLRAELETLVKKLQSVEPKNASEKTLHAKALEELQALTSERRESDRRCCLFKYQDESNKKKWHLVWAPGYRRKDEQSARPIICTNPACSLLFLERADSSDKCPRCNIKPSARAAAAAGGVRSSKLPWALVLLLLIAVLGVAGWWYFNPENDAAGNPAEPVLSVTPESATITRNGQIAYTVTFTDSEGNERDVTKNATVRTRLKEESDDGDNATGRSQFKKTPVDYDIFHNTAKAIGVGTAELKFYYRDREKKYSTTATLVVEPPRNPDVVTIEPSSVRLGVGTTAQLQMWGEYENGRKEDLTYAADWNWEDVAQEGPVFAYNGAVQGINAGETTLRARYRATPESEYVIAEADVEVFELEYSTLNLSLDSEKVAVGQDPGVTVEAVPEKGEPMSVLGSSLLKLEVEPAELADVGKQPPYLYPLKAGEGTLRATFRGISKEIPFQVEESRGPASDELELNPSNLKLAVGEIADVNVSGAGPGPPRFSSSDLDVVEVTPNNRLVGKQPGQATVTVTDGDNEATVNVEVASAPFSGIVFDPGEVSVRVDDVIALRVLGRLEEGTQVEIDPQVLDGVSFPPGDYVEVNRQALDVRGLQPTGNDQKSLTVRLGEHEATAKIRVIPGPLELALEPAGPIELPVGQKQTLKVVASYGNGETEEVPADRVDWIAEPVNGLSLNGGQISADQAEAGPLMVSVEYQGQTSNEVEVRSGPSAPLRFTLTANPPKLAVGKAGHLRLTATTPGEQDVELDMSSVRYESDDESIATVNESSGGFRALKEGTVTLSARHPSTNDPVTAEIQVTAESAEPQTLPGPQSIRIATGQSQPIELPVGVGFVDFEVIANIDGEDVPVSQEATLLVEGDQESAAVQIRNGAIYGVRPGEAVVKAEAGGMTSGNELKFQVVENLELDRIALNPDHVNLAVNENTRLVAEAFHEGRSVGIITDMNNLEWKSGNENVVAAEGPFLTALSEGTSPITAERDGVVSNEVKVNVSNSTARLVQLRVEPSTITLHPNSAVQVGRNVRVLRGDTDLTQQAVVSPANSDIVSYEDDTRTLKAGVPGRTRVTFVVGEQTADLNVVVLDEALDTTGGRLIVEPESGVIAVGERLPLSVTLITADGERVPMTSSASFSSSDPELAEIEGAGVKGVKPGRGIDIQATIPGLGTPATATFHVRNYDFTDLNISPWKGHLFVRQEQRFKVYAVGPAGRRELGTDPNLTVTLTHGDENGREETLDKVDAQGFRVIEANYPTIDGKKTVTAKWKDLTASRSFTISDNRFSGLIIRPQQANIEVGETLDYQIFGRFSGRIEPLSNVDGVELSVDDPAIGSRTAALRVAGKSVGRTGIVATYEGRRATAELIVRPRSRPIPPPSDPERVRFLVNSSRMELGTPGDLVELVYVYPDGSTEDVSEKAEIIANPEGIVDVEYRGNVPFIRPREVGQTQLHARVGPLRTNRPMLIEVAKDLPGNPRLIVNPNPMILSPGETESFGRVAFLRAGGRNPIDVPYQVTATPNDVFEVDDNRRIRAKSPGIALATVKMQDSENRYDGLSASVQIHVREGNFQTDMRQSGELELRGPSRTTEGAEVEYQVRLVRGGNVADVTNDASLVLAAEGEEEYARLEPGGRLIAVKPGTVNVQARYEGKISNTIPLEINPLSSDFQSLELAIDTNRLGVGETRGYQVWGTPSNGGPRQNLTRLVTTDREHSTRPYIRFSILAPNPDADVAVHASPNIIGRNPGKISLQAAIGDRLLSNVKTINVGGEIVNPVDLRVEPGAITSRVGETTPPLKVLVRVEGDRRFRELEPGLAEYAIVNKKLKDKIQYLETIDGMNGRFLAKRPGETRIRVEYGELATFANVSVVPDRFQSIKFGKMPDWITQGTFVVPITIRTDQFSENLEYRAYKLGARPPEEKGWKPAAAQGDKLVTRLTSPEFNAAKSDLFRVIIECREKGTNDIHKYPKAFELGIDSKNQPPPPR